MTLLLLTLLTAVPDDTPRARLLLEQERITTELPSLHGWAAVATTGSLMFGSGLGVALLAGLGGTGDVSAMAFFLIGIPSIVAGIGAVLLVVGIIAISRRVALREQGGARLEEIQHELLELDREGTPQPVFRDVPAPMLRLAAF